MNAIPSVRAHSLVAPLLSAVPFPPSLPARPPSGPRVFLAGVSRLHFPLSLSQRFLLAVALSSRLCLWRAFFVSPGSSPRLSPSLGSPALLSRFSLLSLKNTHHPSLLTASFRRRSGHHRPAQHRPAPSAPCHVPREQRTFTAPHDLRPIIGDTMLFNDGRAFLHFTEGVFNGAAEPHAPTRRHTVGSTFTSCARPADHSYRPPAAGYDESSPTAAVPKTTWLSPASRPRTPHLSAAVRRSPTPETHPSHHRAGKHRHRRLLPGVLPVPAKASSVECGDCTTACARSAENRTNSSPSSIA